jgi:hypothetical protein
MRIILKLFYGCISNKIGVSSLKMAIMPKHLGTN